MDYDLLREAAQTIAKLDTVLTLTEEKWKKAEAALERVRELKPFRADAYSEDAPVILYDELVAACDLSGEGNDES